MSLVNHGPLESGESESAGMMNLQSVGIISYKGEWWRFGADKRRAEREEEERKRLNRIATGNRWFIEEIPESSEPPFHVMVVDYSAPGYLRPSRPVRGKVVAFFATYEAGMVHLDTLACAKYKLMGPDGSFSTMLCLPAPTHWTSDQIEKFRRRSCPPHRFIEIGFDGMFAKGTALPDTSDSNRQNVTKKGELYT